MSLKGNLMLYKLSKFFEQFGAGRDEREMSENCFFIRFPYSNSISLRDYRLILCVVADVCINYNTKLAS